jgi:hypothetical protein
MSIKKPNPQIKTPSAVMVLLNFFIIKRQIVDDFLIGRPFAFLKDNDCINIAAPRIIFV